MKRPKIWINGKFVDINNAKVSIFDRGFLYGDGVFETMRSYAGVVFKIDEHIARLFDGFKVSRIRPPYSRQYFKDVVYKALKINGLKAAYIRVAVTRGEGRFGIGYEDKLVPNVVIVAKEFEGYPAWMHESGLSARITEIGPNEHSPLSKIKSMNYLGSIVARLYAKEDGCDEAILKNSKGNITEAATSNIFLVDRGKLITPSPSSGILPGVTRDVVVKIARAMRLKVIEKAVSPRDLINADEIFLTNSLAEILPVIRVDSRKIGSGRPGEVTKLLHISYQKEVIRQVVFRSASL